MKTNIFVFSYAADKNPPVILFAVPEMGVQLDTGAWSLDEFAQHNNLTRHDSYDWAVGDRGAQAALMEIHPEKRSLSLRMPAGETNVRWLNFKDAARSLADGNQRRLLQLAVQFLSDGAKIDDSVIAAPADEELLNQIK